MKGRLALPIALAVLLVAFCMQDLIAAEEEIRVRGGKAEDFEDSDGRIWYGAQKDNQPWGGWVEKKPGVAEVAVLTDDAKQKAKEAGYDKELFYAVTFAVFPNTVKYQLNTGNGTFDVTILVGEHWSPHNRCFDIFIEGENVSPLYVTPGMNEIDIVRFKGIQVTDGAMDFHFAATLKEEKAT